MPTEPTAKIRSSAIGTSAICPSIWIPATSQPGPHGITANVVSAVKAATNGEKM